jgi:hypothetical protein
LGREELKHRISVPDLSRTDQLLLILLADDGKPKPVRSIIDIGKEIGLRSIERWNVSDILRKSDSLALLVPGGWEVSHAGVKYLSDRGLIGETHVSQPAISLRKLLPKISNERIREFATEAVSCYEISSYRASTVLCWMGAVGVLQEYVFQHKLSELNAELLRRNPKHKAISALDQISEIKEDTFLDLLQAISVIGKSVKDELKARLKLRNGCGHPNSLSVGALAAAAHLESLINNVFSVF